MKHVGKRTKAKQRHLLVLLGDTHPGGLTPTADGREDDKCLLLLDEKFQPVTFWYVHSHYRLVSFIITALN